MNAILIEQTTGFFAEKFGNEPDKVVLSPGRINIIGEHVDYNDGDVLPAAIDKVICFAFEKNNSQTANIVAVDLNETVTIDLQGEMQLRDAIWTNYFSGVVKYLKESGYELSGFNCVFSSNIPVGSGLSSSAALECGLIFGLQALFGFEISKQDIALMGQKAEHWVGINCGIMDQFASVHGQKNKVIQLDCNTLAYTYHDADFSDYSLVLFDSNVKHSLFTSAYNTRRKECEEGFSILKRNFPELKTYRDCTPDQVETIKEQFSADVYKRVRYVVGEINRVSRACQALDAGNIQLVGQLLFETHDGLSNDYEVSCAELDALVDYAKADEAVIGSRLMGGGFGGCTINLIKKGSEEAVKTKFKALYQAAFDIELKSYDVKISDGTTLYKG
ncbi:galactokinase [Flavobacterium agrisoli]|uniref:Galactokinase n=1 Tax=Flavobacterium agrisoli TaxID=2793066 RepID=A0A934UKR9_9FLAO|nr:galactokinase [Flavobacterium agrisoli]MBK0370848.1 galactokinase [Flavobacterium agrisoli]